MDNFKTAPILNVHKYLYGNPEIPETQDKPNPSAWAFFATTPSAAYLYPPVMHACCVQHQLLSHCKEKLSGVGKRTPAFIKRSAQCLIRPVLSDPSAKFPLNG